MKFNVKAKELINIINKVSKITAQPCRYIDSNPLNNILIRFKNNKLEFIATDRNKLIVKELECEVLSTVKKDVEAVFDIKLLKNIKYNKNDIVNFILTSNYLVIEDKFNNNSINLSSIKSPFPNIDMLFEQYFNEKESVVEFSINKNYLKELINAHEGNDTINFKIYKSLDPILIKDETTKSILMPIQVR